MPRTRPLRDASYRESLVLPKKIYSTIPYFSNARLREILDDHRAKALEHELNNRGSFLNRGPDLAKMILAENVKVFEENSNADKDTVDAFQEYLRVLSFGTWGDSHIDAELLSFYTINEFINNPANEELTYGDYLEAHWDDDYNAVLKLKFNIYPNTKDLSKKLHHASSLAFHKDLSNSEKKFIENLSFDEIKYLVELPAGSLSSKVDKNSKHLKLLLTYKDSKTRIPTQQEIKTLILNIFMKKISTMALPHKYDVPAFYANVGELLKDTSISSSPSNMSASSVYSGDIGPVLSFIFDNLDKFSLQDVMGFIVSLSSKPTFSRSGSFADYGKFLKVIVSENKTEDAIEALKIVSEVIIRSDNQRPTMNEWKKAYNAGLLDGSLPQELFVTLATADKPFAPTGIITYVRKLLA